MRYGLRAANKNDIATQIGIQPRVFVASTQSLNVMERPGPRSQDLMLIQA